MKIHSFKFEDKESGLKIEPISFSNLTLLVGASGVGKTIILQSLMDLKDIARGKSLTGVEWEIHFSIKNNENYLWKGAFEKTGNPRFIEKILYKGEKEIDNLPRPKILYEELYKNDQKIVERKDNKFKFEGKTTPKLSSYESALNLLREEESIIPVFTGFNELIKNDDYNITQIETFVNFESFSKQFSELDSIKQANIVMYLKLALINKNHPEIFNTIKEHFITVFNHVEDIKFEILPVNFNRFSIYLQIKEKDTSKWIFPDRISSGMLKTLFQISQLFLCAEGTVILIDEFENSLGINCIDTLTENLRYDDRDIQYIVTSHHPYIINSIGMEHWKIVSRKGGTISTKDAKEYKLGNSKHEAFMQLIQLDEYRKGITG
jgi:ABC-type dipeptide/oligopeptide/nickel transport system ATPase component